MHSFEELSKLFADRFAVDVKRDEQSLFGKRCRRTQIWITSLPVSEQHRNIAVEHIAARAEIARGATAGVWLPCPGNGCPVEPFFVFRQQTQAGGIGLQDLQNSLGQRLQNGARRVGQRADQRHERAILLLVIGRTQWATI